MAFSMGRICQRSTGILLGLEGSIHFEDRDDVPSNMLDVRLEDALWWVLQHAWIGLLDREGCGVAMSLLKLGLCSATTS